MRSNYLIVRGTCLQVQHAGYDLQTVLHPMCDFLEQELLAVQGCLELTLASLPFDRHA
jgi:hypothetical protein